VKKALAIILDDHAATANRIALAQALAEARNRAVIPVLLKLFSRSGNAAGVIRQGILPFAAQFDERTLAEAVARDYETRFSQTVPLRDAAHRMLASRPEWARMLLTEIEQHHIRAADVAPDVVRQLGLYRDPEIARLTRKHWPLQEARLSSREKLAELNRIKGLLGHGSGDAQRGRELFTQRCAACHTLFDAGGKVGPELTGYDRANLDFWLVAILDPSLEIREGYGAYTLQLKDGRTLIGMLERQDATGVAIKDMAGQVQTAAVDQVEKLQALPQSLMPEGLLTGLDEAALRDLFAYLSKP
jgi:putative heme-binding domain-containing protein